MQSQNLKALFQSKYDRKNWISFIYQIFPKSTLHNNPKALSLNNEIAKEGFELGSFETSDGAVIGIFEVKINDKVQIDKNRIGLRNLLRPYYKQIDGVFAVYYKQDKWRFSYISETRIRDEKGNWADSKTEPKRFTYVLGADETVKTAVQRFEILSNSKKELSDIKEAFSVEKITKEFYRDIANWYFWATDNVMFPIQAEEIENGRNISVIRLITRLIFIWFMKELKLIPSELFEKTKIKNILKNDLKDESIYYKAILQNLFFATLSTKKEQRQFAEKERYNIGQNKDFGNHNVFRYQEYFKYPENIKTYFQEIPFLNGGLFECLDNKKERLYVDGFSRTKKNQPTVPDLLFFSDEIKVDLNKWYGSSNKEYKVRGLLNILSSYSFTVNENSIDDVYIALDPELLGKVFENLLANFNPETSTTARKSTGSFYTPREIVDYMVSESLKEYFRTYLIDIEDINNKINILFENSDNENPFNTSDCKKIVNLIENVRIVDPAVGSGAFPMGILNKLVFILNKVDDGNKLWKEAQIKGADYIPDPIIREETKKHIGIFFETKNIDYLRKLYLLQKCIYGVDIQQIAVEIAKLRFFISLLVEEKIDYKKENYGIEPLPNLDFKIMQGNSLLDEYEGIKLFDESLFEDINSDRRNQYNILKKKQKDIEKRYFDLRKSNKLKDTIKKEIEIQLEDIAKKIKNFLDGKKPNDNIFDIFDTYSETNEKRDNLLKLHKDYFEASVKEKKDNIKKEIDNLEWELIESTLISQKETLKLEKLKKLRKTNSRPFFLWKLHFADVFKNGGFDIVIGNPPYIKEYTMRNAFDGLRNSEYYQGKMDLWYLFACKNLDIIKKETGILTFIATNNWTTNSGASKMRNKILNDAKIIKLIDFGSYMVFESADIQTMIMIFKNSKNNDNYKFELRKLAGNNINFEDTISLINGDYTEKTEFLSPTISKNEFLNNSLTFSNEIIENVLDKIKSKHNFSLFEDTEIAQGIVIPQDYLNKSNKFILGDNFKVGQGIFVLNEEEKSKINFNKKELELLKPYFTTKQLGKWFGDPQNTEWIIYTDSKFKYPDNIKPYPNFKQHLDKFQEVITSDNKPYGLHRSREEYFFKDEKIIALRKCVGEPIFTYTDFDCYVSATFYVIKTKRISLKYLTAILNSKLIAFWLKNKGKMQGTNYQLDKEPLLRIPVYKSSDVKILENIVDYILQRQYVNYFEDLANAIIYELYFPDLIKKAGCEIIKYLTNLPELNTNWSDSIKFEIIKKVYNKLTTYSDPVNIAMKGIKKIDEIMIIEKKN